MYVDTHVLLFFCNQYTAVVNKPAVYNAVTLIPRYFLATGIPRIPRRNFRGGILPDSGANYIDWRVPRQFIDVTF